MANVIALMPKRAKRDMRQKAKSFWKVMSAQQGIIACKGEKVVRAKSKNCTKTSMNT